MQKPLRRAAVITMCLVAVGCDGTRVEGEELGKTTEALETPWSVVELGGGFNPSLSLDGAGNPALSIARGVPMASNHDGDVTPVFVSNDGSWRAGTGWRSTVLSHEPGKINGNANAVAFAPSAQVAYTSRIRADKNSGYVLKLARQAGLNWQTSTVEDSPWVYQMKQQVHDGSTYLVYTNPPNPGIRIARSDGTGTWTKTSLTTIPYNLLSSIDAVLAPVDDPKAPVTLGIATTTLSPTTGPEAPAGLHFVSSPDGGTNWKAVVHVDDSDAAIGPQVAYAGVNPQISYTGVNDKLAKWASSSDGGHTWTVEKVAQFEGSPATGLTVDKNGEPVMAIAAPDPAAAQSRLYIARRKAPGVWALELVDSIRAPLAFDVNPRVAVTPDGRIVIAYTYGTVSDSHVRFAWSAPL
jgi:hypothetical protein